MSLLWFISSILLCSCRSISTNLPVSIEDSALDKVLQDASPIFGHYKPTDSVTSRWMANYSNETLLVHMNLPGTHDSQTWNYSSNTRKSLNYITRLRGSFTGPSKFYQCQQVPIISMLDQGIRVFDLRFAFDVTQTRLVFWHAQALQSQIATVHDVLFAFCRWLNDHPSETVLISLKYEKSTTIFARNNKKLQQAIFDTLTSDTIINYFLATKNELLTLGHARGKIVLIRRFDLDKLPISLSEKVPGIYLSPSEWTRNGRDIKIIYNRDKNHVAHIEDYFHISTKALNERNLDPIIQSKFEATINHLEKAMSNKYLNHLFWTFTSGEKNTNLPPIFPKKVALGEKNIEGMNYRLNHYFQNQMISKRRLGIVMFDFFEEPNNLIKHFLAIQSP